MVLVGAANIFILFIVLKLTENVQVKKFPWPVHGLYAQAGDAGLVGVGLPKPSGRGLLKQTGNGLPKARNKGLPKQKDQGFSIQIDQGLSKQRGQGNQMDGEDAKLQKGIMVSKEEGSGVDNSVIDEPEKNSKEKLDLPKLKTPVNKINIVDGSVSYFQNEDFSIYSEPVFGENVFTVSVTNRDVCQVRIDFEEFMLADPTAEGECIEESITIDDSIEFCGENKGQHYYVHINEVPHNINIIMKMSKETTFRFMHSLKVSQIDCSTNEPAIKDITAPRGCTQYFHGISGTITSFNYDGINMYPENQDYSICIHKPANSCGIIYKNSPTNTKPTSVGLSSMSSDKGCMSSDGSGGDGSTDSGCGEVCLSQTMGSGGPRIGDWITIGQGQPMDYQDLSNPLSYKAYYCGSGLGVDTDKSPNLSVGGQGVMDFSGGPFVLHFHTDNNNKLTRSGGLPQTNNLGFVIQYLVQLGNCK